MLTDSLLPGSVKSEKQHRLDICVAGRWMYQRDHIAACEGNLSVRLDSQRILTTPTCMNKGMLAPSDLVVMDLEGRQISGERKASSEIAMHLLFYRMRPDVYAICHAHPPTATGFAVVGRALDQALLPEVIVGLGQIPLVTQAAELAGNPTLLSSREVAKLMAARSRYFVVPPPGAGAELPVTCDSVETSNDHVRLTRNELDALIDEAVRKDRARR